MCNKNKIILTTGKGNINTFGGLKSMILSLSSCNEKRIKELEVGLKWFFFSNKKTISRLLNKLTNPYYVCMRFPTLIVWEDPCTKYNVSSVNVPIVFRDFDSVCEPTYGN